MHIQALNALQTAGLEHPRSLGLERRRPRGCFGHRLTTKHRDAPIAPVQAPGKVTVGRTGPPGKAVQDQQVYKKAPGLRRLTANAQMNRHTAHMHVCTAASKTGSSLRLLHALLVTHWMVPAPDMEANATPRHVSTAGPDKEPLHSSQNCWGKNQLFSVYSPGAGVARVQQGSCPSLRAALCNQSQGS